MAHECGVPHAVNVASSVLVSSVVSSLDSHCYPSLCETSYSSLKKGLVVCGRQRVNFSQIKNISTHALYVVDMNFPKFIGVSAIAGRTSLLFLPDDFECTVSRLVPTRPWQPFTYS